VLHLKPLLCISTAAEPVFSPENRFEGSTSSFVGLETGALHVMGLRVGFWGLLWDFSFEKNPVNPKEEQTETALVRL